MAGTSKPIFPQSIVNGLAQILPADTTTDKTLYTAGSNGSKVECILISNTDASNSYDIQFKIVNGATTYILGTITTQASSGNANGNPATNVLANSVMTGLAKDLYGNPYLYLASGSVLKASSLITVTTAKIVSIISQGGDY